MQITAVTTRQKNYGFQFRTTIYPFDFQGDCNCPTFSKENELIKKGFFVRLSPGLGKWETNIIESTGQQIFDLNAILFELTSAIGIDIGISNAITISPELGYRKILGGKWSDNTSFTFNGFNLFQPAVRLGLRFDKKNFGFKPPRRRRR